MCVRVGMNALLRRSGCRDVRVREQPAPGNAADLLRRIRQRSRNLGRLAVCTIDMETRGRIPSSQNDVWVSGGA